MTTSHRSSTTNSSAVPPRGFPVDEYESRTQKAQQKMAAQGVDLLLLTTEPEFRYFTGFLSQFWQSPTRPWFLIVPAEGKPVTVVPTIGEAALNRTWLDDVRVWNAPAPEDDGISLLADTIAELAGEKARIGVPVGHETHLRMPLADYQTLQAKLGKAEFRDATGLIRSLRMVKSPREIEKVAYVCGRVSTVFEALPTFVTEGMPASEAFRQFKIKCLESGVDDVSYLVGGAGPDGYDDIISPPGDRPLQAGDVLIMDTGCMYDGYFCDFDRNYAIGHASEATKAAYRAVYEATEAGFAAAKPGATTSDLYHAMQAVMDRAGALGNSVGRLGHGLGMQLTEAPSNHPNDHTVLEVGMVMTLEPGMAYLPQDGSAPRSMVHEENLIITQTGASWLTRRAPPEIPIV